MLTYHPALDPNHAAFRMLRLLVAANGIPLEPLKLRILDFYLLFPHLLRKFVFPTKLKAWRAQLPTSVGRYFLPGAAPGRFVFAQMRGAQEHAISLLAAKGLLESENLAAGRLVLKSSNLPSILSDEVTAANGIDVRLITLLTQHLAALPLGGPDGLKGRSHLEDYRYDAA